MDAQTLVIGAVALLGAVVFLVLVPPRIVRGWALATTIAVTTVAGNNSVPRDVWVPAYAFCALLLVIAISRVPFARPPLRSAFTVMAAWWAFLAVGVLVHGSYSLPRMVAYFGLGVVVTLVTTQTTVADRRVLLRSVLAIACAEAVWGLVEVAAHLTPLWGYRGDYVRTNPLFADEVARAQGSMGHPIVLGLLCGIGVVIAWSNQVRIRHSLRFGALLVTAGGVVLSGTRSVLLALVVALVVHLLLRGRLGSWLRNAALVVVGGSLVFLLDFGISRLVDELVASGSYVHRIGSISAIPALLGRPLGESLWGSGFGSEVSLFERGYIAKTFGLEVVDDFWVYLLGTTGIVGAAGFLAICVWAFVRADRQGRTLVTFLVVMFLSFDVMVWTYAGILLTMFFVLPAEPRGPRPGSATSVELANGIGQRTDATEPTPAVRRQQREPAQVGARIHLPERFTRGEEGEAHEGRLAEHRGRHEETDATRHR